MSKKLGFLSVVFIAILFGGLFLHKNIIADSANELPFPLSEVYLFNGIFSVVLCFGLRWLGASQKFADQLGFLYLASVVLKAFVFLIVFNTYLFNGESFTNSEAISLLCPLIIALIFEVFFLSILLSQKRVAKNEE